MWFTGYVLKATNVKSKHSGYYCCAVGGTDTCTENSTTQLVVAVTPELTIHDPMMSVTHGESVELTCNHANPDTIPIRMQWYKNDTLLFTGEKYTISVVQQTQSYTLQIHNVTENDEGVYNCIADSPHSSISIGIINLTVTSAMPSVTSITTTITPGSNPTTEQPSSNTVNENLIMMMTLVMFPVDVKCELAKIIKVDADLQAYLMNLCNCTNFMIHGVSFVCINDSRASYSFLITGKEASEAATIFNYTISAQEYLLTGDGISFSLHNSVNNVTTSPSSLENDSDTIDVYLFILVIVLVATAGLIVVVGLSVTMCCYCKKAEQQSKENSSNIRHYENMQYVPPQPTNNIPTQLHLMHTTTV